MRVWVAALWIIGCRDRAAPSPTPAPALAPSSSIVLPTSLSGPTSTEELGRAFVGALAANDRRALEALFVTLPEYGALIYPELVKANEPLVGSMGLQWAWDNLEHSSRKDLRHLLEELGGKRLAYQSIETAPNQPRAGVAIYPRVVVHAELDGKPIDIKAIFAIVSRDGRYRVLRYRGNRDD